MPTVYSNEDESLRLKNWTKKIRKPNFLFFDLRRSSPHTLKLNYFSDETTFVSVLVSKIQNLHRLRSDRSDTLSAFYKTQKFSQKDQEVAVQ